ncbi:hypothetical protein MRB53_017800 [Persea americana]|uniref:Uncharacterized protein n=1 Tax=Persea americana TaxID=3435 RepID=A0ACC2M6Z3_PERAE|nr:hypothetical protein MRB53_017800 [Persea americana]
MGAPPSHATFARVYSNQGRHDCALVHSTALAFGENIFIGQGQQWSTKDVVAAWVVEKQFYDYSSNACSAPTAPTTPRSCGTPQSAWGVPRSSVTMAAAISLASIIPQGTMFGMVWCR